MATIRLELEELLLGKKDSLHFLKSYTREEIMDELNAVILLNHPGTNCSGVFVNKEQSDYVVYDMHFTRLQNFDCEGIRVLDFGDKVTILRI